jgi:hypothetical protein
MEAKKAAKNKGRKNKIQFVSITPKGGCTNEWLTFVTFFNLCNTHLVLLFPSKTYSVKFSNWDLV